MKFKFEVGFYLIVTLILITPCSRAYTAEQDVFAINAFYTALGSPLLPGWVATGGDPCSDGWQGVQCLESNITGIVLNGANLGGQLGDALGSFTSIVTIDLSNNNIGGSIPENLPITIQSLFLSANQFTGNLPSSLSKLTLLTAMSVNANHLTGELPDAFESLASLVNFDLSSNNLSGNLPPSVGGLSSLTTLHVQNNQLTGTLDVLEDLPLKDLNIEDNLFAGPIPEKLLTIQNFRKDGNPFNTIVAPSLAPLPAPPIQSTPPSPMTPSTPSRVPTSGAATPTHATSTYKNSSGVPIEQPSSSATKKQNMSTMKIVGYVLLSVVLFAIIVLMVIFCLLKYRERETMDYGFLESQIGMSGRSSTESKIKELAVKPNNNVRKVTEGNSETRNGHVLDTTTTDQKNSLKQEKETGRQRDVMAMPLRPLPLPPSLPRVEKKNVVKPILPSGNVSPENMDNIPPRNLPPASLASFSVGSLQQYTNSFSEENLIRDEGLGKVYLAELPDGKLLEVLKIDNVNSRIQTDNFLELITKVSELKHPNILELVGYCVEHGQRLLMYKHFSSRTLHDILYGGAGRNANISWDARLHIALGTAKALEYLHEGCQPPIVHRDFEPANILIDDGFAACVSECGLYSLMSSNSVTQLSGRMRAIYSYEAPEVSHNGSYTEKSDVYSFGIVMLELLTGRRPFDSSRPRLEQHLVRWASTRLHDINALRRMVDPSITGNYSEKSLSGFADIISRCIQHGPEFRPAMSEIVHDLTRMIKDFCDKQKEDLV